MKKIMRIHLTMLAVFSMMNTCVFAATASGYASNSAGQIAGKAATIINALAWIGYVISFGMFIYIGIKYVLSAANEKATLKQGAVNYLIGGILIACASVVADIVASVANQTGASGAGGYASQLISAAKDAAGLN